MAGRDIDRSRAIMIAQINQLPSWDDKDPHADLVIREGLSASHIRRLLDYYYTQCGYTKWLRPTAGIKALIKFCDGDILSLDQIDELLKLLLERARRISATNHSYEGFQYYHTDTAKFDGTNFIEFASRQKLTNVIYMIIGTYFCCEYESIAGKICPICPITYRQSSFNRMNVRNNNSNKIMINELINYGAYFNPVRVNAAYELQSAQNISSSKADSLWKHIRSNTPMTCAKCKRDYVENCRTFLCHSCRENEFK